MRTLVCHHCGDYHDLTVEDLAIPELPDNGVRIEVDYAKVIFLIGLWGACNYHVKPPQPFNPSAEVLGGVRERAPGLSSACR